MIVHALTLLAAVGSGVVAGVFLAFSAFVMRALAQLPHAAGMHAMQAINRAAPRAPFLCVFLGTAAASLAISAAAWGEAKGAEAVLLLTGCALYLIGSFGVTVARNVPLNDALAAAECGSPSAEALWRGYVVRWTAWNHVRAAAAAAASAAYCLALAL